MGELKVEIKEVVKSRTISFNAIMGAAIPLFNHFFPGYAITAALANDILVLGNIALRFMTDRAVGQRDG